MLLDKKAFLGGNSVKATSGINASESKAQKELGIKDTNEAFEKDINQSANKGLPGPGINEIQKTMVRDSAPAVQWLSDSFGLDLSKVSRLGGHSFPRTHRGAEKFPGMAITYAQIKWLSDMAKKEPNRMQIITKARANKLLVNDKGEVVGC